MYPYYDHDVLSIFRPVLSVKVDYNPREYVIVVQKIYIKGGKEESVIIYVSSFFGTTTWPYILRTMIWYRFFMI